MPMINELPEVERPRERLMLYGADALSNTELIAILVGSGRTGSSAIDLAANILAKSDLGIGYLATASVEEIKKISGVGNAVACRILAAAALGRRMAMSVRQTATFSSPEEIAAIFMEDMRRETQETFRILLLNIRNEMIGRETISLGNISSSIVDPRDVFKPAVRRGAASIVLVHNHPSGNPEPSGPDIDVTERLCKAGEILGVKVMDHIIIGDGTFVSMKKNKILFR